MKKTCPCCSNSLLRHARRDGSYWFCSYCWQEMPDLASASANRHLRTQQVAQLERLVRGGLSSSNLLV